MAKVWTKKEEAFLKKHYRKMSGKELAKKFSVSSDAVRKKEKKLGLVRKHPRRKKKKKVAPPTPKKWTVKEEQHIKKHYLKKTNAELAKRFRTTPKSVEKKLWRMRLKKRKGGTAAGSLEEKRERMKRIEEFLKKKRPPKEKEKIDKRRSQAIALFEIAVRLYYARKYKRAERAFRKLIKEFADIHDVVYKAEQYTKFCLDKK